MARMADLRHILQGRAGPALKRIGPLPQQQGTSNGHHWTHMLRLAAGALHNTSIDVDVDLRAFSIHASRQMAENS